MVKNLAQTVFSLLDENKELLEKIKQLEKELYECKVQLMHVENTAYIK